MSLKTVKRFDYGQVTKPVRTPQGFLRCPVRATRVGVFNYRMPDGSILRELRLPEEVFKDESMATLAGAPVTNDHPPVALLDPSNVKHYSVGVVSDLVSHDDQFVTTVATIMDQAAIEDVLAGKEEVSCGYTCQLEEVAGTWNGDDYDVIQRNIVYNHLACVDRGRAGPQVRLKLDSADGVMLDAAEAAQLKGKRLMAKKKIGDSEFEVSQDIADAIGKMEAGFQGMADGFKKQMDALQAKVDAYEAKEKKDSGEEAKKKMDALQARCDSMEQENKNLKEKAASQPDLKAAVAARVKLIQVAGSCLESEQVAKLDEMDDQGIMAAVIKAEHPEANLDGKSETYIQARFDAIQEARSASGSRSRAAGAAVLGTDENGKPRQDAKEPKTADEARAKAMRESQEAYKQPLGKSRSK